MYDGNIAGTACAGKRIADRDIHVGFQGYLAIRGAVKRTMQRLGLGMDVEKIAAESIDDTFDGVTMDSVKKGVIGAAACMLNQGMEAYGTFLAELSKEGRLDRATIYFAEQIMPEVVQGQLNPDSFVNKALTQYLIRTDMPASNTMQAQQASHSAVTVHGCSNGSAGPDAMVSGYYVMPTPKELM